MKKLATGELNEADFLKEKLREAKTLLGEKAVAEKAVFEKLLIEKDEAVKQLKLDLYNANLSIARLNGILERVNFEDKSAADIVQLPAPQPTGELAYKHELHKYHPSHLHRAELRGQAGAEYDPVTGRDKKRKHFIEL
jgi:hypothetical protein